MARNEDQTYTSSFLHIDLLTPYDGLRQIYVVFLRYGVTVYYNRYQKLIIFINIQSCYIIRIAY
jgi:hypothetical protein